MNITKPATAIAALLALAAIPATAATPVRSRYLKHEFRIPMRDGVRLFTAVYVPRDASPGRRYPILLKRTPYSVRPYGVDHYPEQLGPSSELQDAGFIFVYQDVRGRWMSEGNWEEMRPQAAVRTGPRDIDESTDAWDTVDWLVKNAPHNDGRVGMWGISYPGFFAAAALIDSHPALVAVSPQAPVADYYLGDDSFHNGAFLLAHNFSFYTSFFPRSAGPGFPERRRFDYGTPDGYEYYLRLGTLRQALEALDGNPYFALNLDHPTYDDFWRERSIWRHLEGVKPAVLTVAGWFDAEDLQGPLRVYHQIEGSSPGADNRLVIGPWDHGGWSEGAGDRLGQLRFATDTAAFYREQIEAPFFLEHLKGGPASGLPEAMVYQTGRDVWERHDTWPPADARPRRLYLAGGGRLQWQAPTAVGDDARDDYPSDPARPVPLVGYTAQNMPGDYMTSDQRFAATRPDVLVYRTRPLEQDLCVAGPVGVELFVATTGTAADFVVKLIDVYPGDHPNHEEPAGDGYPVEMGSYQQLVRGEPFRGRFREGFEREVPFVPGEPAAIRFEMPDVSHCFRTGHAVMVHVQSSWFPYIDRNPQTFVRIPDAVPEDFRAQTHSVFRSAARPSALVLGVRR